MGLQMQKRTGCRNWPGCVLLAALIFGGSAGSALAQRNLPVPNFEQPNPQDQEQEVPPPAYPLEENLVAFPVDNFAHAVLIDKSTFSAGADGIVRFVMIVRTAGGAENVSFEGLRCKTGERRTYALGRRDKTWVVPRNSVWQEYDVPRSNRHIIDLHRNVFCVDHLVATRGEMLMRLERGGRK